MSDHGDWGGRPILSDKDWRKGTEYGGVEGLVAPIDSPHTPSMTAHEQLMFIRAIDPMDGEIAPIAELKKMAP